MSIVRVGLGETAKFAEGYEAIFGKKKPASSRLPRRGEGRVKGKSKSGKKAGASTRKKKARKK